MQLLISRFYTISVASYPLHSHDVSLTLRYVTAQLAYNFMVVASQ